MTHTGMQSTIGLAANELLRAQASSNQIALAIQGPFLLAILGIAFTLRRPGMRAYAVVYGLFSLASVSSAISLFVVSSQGSPFLHDALLALALAFVSAAWAANIRALRALSGRPRSAPLAVLPLAMAGALAVLTTFALRELPIDGRFGALLKTWSPRPLFLLLMASATLMAWHSAKGAPRNALALRLVALSFFALTIRQTYGIVVALQAAGGSAVTPGWVIFVQAATAVLNGVALLAALMIEERAAMTEQAERMRLAELQAARSQRLESLGQMAGGIAHDFANVMTVISGGVSGARQADSIDEASALLVDAEVAVERAAGLTRQLALFSQRKPPTVGAFTAASRIQSMAPLLHRLAGGRVQLDVTTIPDAPGRLQMDPSQFDQLLLNLVVNARDAMPNGGRILVEVRSVAEVPEEEHSGAMATVSVARADADSTPAMGIRLSGGSAVATMGRYVHVRVADDGIGIPESELERIFEPFFTTKGDRGTGLGLATVAAVVERARGTLRVSSAVGVGTAFDIFLPEAP